MNFVPQDGIGIEAYACATALGNAAETCRRLALGEVALRPHPFLGKLGGDPVPLAIIGSYEEALPPRWERCLKSLAEQVPFHPWGSPRFPVFLTSSNYDVGSLYAYGESKNQEFLKLGTPAHTLSHLKKVFGWGDNSLALSHACVTANLGLELACRHIALGLADKALVFSFDFVSPFVAGGFHALKILNESFPAPFQEREIGSIGLGDGAAFAVLSRDSSPFSIASNFLYNEMYHFTSNDPSGSGFAAGAAWLAAAVDGRPLWIKAHGTGTLDAGRLEAKALGGAFPDSPIVSWKGSLGHTLGSCGAVELTIAIEAFKQGKAPGTVGASQPTMAPSVAIEPFSTAGYHAAALFSNAFGGAHAACLLRYDP